MNKDNEIRCRSCSRALLTVSPSGFIPVEIRKEAGCELCEPFQIHYDTLRQADTKWQEAAPKKDTNRSKILARENHKKAHMNFDNWLMGVEVCIIPSDVKHETGSAPIEQVSSSADKSMQEHRQEKKRVRSHSPVSRQHRNVTELREGASLEPNESEGSAPPSRPSSKRSLSTVLLPGHKKLKFADSVEFRDEYRDSSRYQRSGDSYIKGRYALKDGSDYLDTSGSTQSFLKFTREKKVKDKWIEVDEKDAEKGNKYTAELRKLGASEGGPTQESSSGEPGLDFDPNTHLDARAQRLVRRSRPSTRSVTQDQQRGQAYHNHDLMNEDSVHFEDGERRDSAVDDPSTLSAIRGDDSQNGANDAVGTWSREGGRATTKVDEITLIYNDDNNPTPTRLSDERQITEKPPMADVLQVLGVEEFSNLRYPKEELANTHGGLFAGFEPTARLVGNTYPNMQSVNKEPVSLQHDTTERQEGSQTKGDTRPGMQAGLDDQVDSQIHNPKEEHNSNGSPTVVEVISEIANPHPSQTNGAGCTISP
jgi:hypothetical protein